MLTGCASASLSSSVARRCAARKTALIKLRFFFVPSATVSLTAACGAVRNMNSLVQAELKNGARRFIQLAFAQQSNPKIEQTQVAQHAVEKFAGKCTVGVGEARVFEQIVNYCVSESFLSAPFTQRP